MIAGLLLASGASHRFGSNKLAEPLGDRAVVRWSADALVHEVDELFVVVPDAAREIRDALAGLAARFVVNEREPTGLASSIRAGVAALPPSAEAVVLTLGDQPLLDRAVTARVIARWCEGGVSAVAACYEDGRGHPVLFGATLFPALDALEGDRGARALLDGLGEDLALVDVMGAQPIDVDTREALDVVALEIARGARERR
ncbi:MAG: nucleotidyltransferase family protein [bacterium]